MEQVEQALWCVASQVFRARRKRGASQEQIAHHAQIAVHTYRRIETGGAGSSLDSLIRAMAVLGIEHLYVPGPGRPVAPSQEDPRASSSRPHTACAETVTAPHCRSDCLQMT
ncbi:helix-turn-helix domain-containing protein [Microbacterium galbum]|uniref:helix-turn-helix domain-containing protein n=1 Tax=Microbacterium galbum TaxID=3075994 RepID=UPI0034609D3A